MRKEIKEKLEAKKLALTKALGHADSQQKKYEARLKKGVACIKPTYYGEVSAQMQNNMRARYFWARWAVAVASIERRIAKLNRKLKLKKPRTLAEALNEGLEKAKAVPEDNPWQMNVYVANTGGTTTAYTNTLTWTTNNTTG